MRRRRPRSGLYPATFPGAWHRSTLVLHPTFNLFRNNTRVSSFDIPAEMSSVSLTLHKRGYGAYRAACASPGRTRYRLGVTEVPPHSSGATSTRVSEKVQ